MNPPTPNDIHHALRSIENAERSEEHPRTLARKAIAEWRSNAAKENLPVVNVTDDKGGRRLNTDEVLRRSEPGHAGRKG